jgi:hypothetical protein
VSRSAFTPRSAAEGRTPDRPQFSNWGRWGDDDEAGAANHLTPERTLTALALARTGHIIHLGQVLGDPNAPRNSEHTIHLMSSAAVQATQAASPGAQRNWIHA